MKHGVEHAFGPFDLAAGQFPDPLDQGVTVILTVRQDGEHQRHRGRRNQFFGDHAAILHNTAMPVNRLFECSAEKNDPAHAGCYEKSGLPLSARPTSCLPLSCSSPVVLVLDPVFFGGGEGVRGRRTKDEDDYEDGRRQIPEFCSNNRRQADGQGYK
jgi:hypothetical protein